MKTSPYIKLMALGLTGLLSACSTSSPETRRIEVSVTSSNAPDSLADSIFKEVNSYRAARGKNAFERHDGLDRLAQKHCDYLAARIGGSSLEKSSLNHHGFEGRALLAKHKFRIFTLGENVVSSTNHSPKHLVKLWSESDTHEHNMSSDWALTGVGTAKTESGLVISTQVFGTVEDTVHPMVKKKFENRW
ncbi:MAG: CAP domain-containing protein [Akkermansiaceae bacterium]